MLRLLKFLFTGVWHECKYELIDQKETTTSHRHAPMPYKITRTYVSRCNHCGDITSRSVEI